MRKIIAIALAIMLVVSMASMAITAHAESVSVPSVDGVISQQQSRAIDSPFYGRLYIPDVGIDVALYYSLDQDVTDKADSANIFTWYDYPGEVIADHASQEFSKLFRATIGMTGYIDVDNGETIHIKCIDVFDGYNIRIGGLVDLDYNTAHGLADYTLYTCKDNTGDNVRIWLWETYEPDCNIVNPTKPNINVPIISSIKFNIKLDEKLKKAVENAVAEAVKKIDFSSIDFTNIKLTK